MEGNKNLKFWHYMFLCMVLIPQTILAESVYKSELESGSKALTSGDYNKAIKHFDQAISLKGDDVQGYLLRIVAHGFKLKKVKNNTETLEIYRKIFADSNKCIELKPDVPACYLNRAMANAIAGNRDAFSEDLDTAVKLDPSIKNRVAMIRKNFEGEGGKVKSEAPVVSGVHDDSLKVIFEDGKKALYAKKSDLAIEKFSLYIAHKKDNHDAFLKRAMAKFHKSSTMGDNLQKMELNRSMGEDADKCLELNPEVGYCYFLRAPSRLQNNFDTDSYKKDLAQALKYEPRLKSSVDRWLSQLKEKSP